MMLSRFGPFDFRVDAFFLLTICLSLLSTSGAALSPSCAPGGNFDLSKWNLQLPIGKPGSPTTITSSSLQGCSGYQNSAYFYTDGSDGSLVMKVPGDPWSTGCVTTRHSKHCRTELRETNPVSWDPWGPVNRLSATLAVIQAGGSTCVGQIHIDDSVSTKPVAELYYDNNGHITLGMEQTRAGGDQVRYAIGDVPLGQTFSYEIRYENNVFSVSLNGGAQKVITTYNLNAPRSYFKAGNYLQGTSASEVRFYAIGVTHSSPSAGTTTVSRDRPPADATNTPGDCKPEAPDIASDWTVSLKLFSDGNCCSPFQTIKLGNLDSCHNSNKNFASFKQAVGQGTFGRNLHIFAYDSIDCKGEVTDIKLTNAATCWHDDTPSSKWKSLKISSTA